MNYEGRSENRLEALEKLAMRQTGIHDQEVGYSAIFY
jgi:hypothetical protein